MIDFKEQQIKMRNGLNKISEENDIHIEKDELEYYIEHLDILNNPAQKLFINAFFNDITSIVPITSMSKSEYIEAIIIMKKILIEKHKLVFLPYIISGNCISKASFTLPNSMIIYIKDQILNSKFTYVAYEDQERLGTEISFDDHLVKDEIKILISIL